MEIYFNDKKMAKMCNSGKMMRAKLGQQRAHKLQQRLMEFRAADTLSDISRLPPARCHELKGNLEGKLAVVLTRNERLIFVPANDPIPFKPDGGLDWDKVTEIQILEIGDYH